MKMVWVLMLLFLCGCGANDASTGLSDEQERLYEYSVIAKQYSGVFVKETKRTFMFTIMEGKVTCIEHKNKYDFSCFPTPQ